MSKPPDQPVSTEELASLALNEQGFLFQQRIIEEIESRPSTEPFNPRWGIRGVEYPVSVANGKDTRVDVVLSDGVQERAVWHLVLECKRANPDYKRWLFFDTNARSAGGGRRYHIEMADMTGSWDNQGNPPMMHRVDARSIGEKAALYNFYLESRLERPGSGKRVSASEAIEDAFQQVSLGQAGLSRRLREMKKLSFRIASIVVTTAELQAVEFAPNHVSLDRGHLTADQLKLQPVNWLAVNYRINDSIARQVGLTTNFGRDVAEDVLSRHLRTIFVVHASHINAFLDWFGAAIVDA